MKLRIALLCFVVCTLCLAAAAFASAPTASWNVYSRGYWNLFVGSATGGTAPYSYFWSFDGGAFVEGAQINELICGPQGNGTTLDFKVVDDNDQESNVLSFVCP